MLTKEEWIKHKERLEAGGGSLRGYCREHNLRYHQFRYKIKRINAGKFDDTKISKEGFIPISIVKSADVPRDIEIYCTISYPNGIKVVVHKIDVISKLQLGCHR